MPRGAGAQFNTSVASGTRDIVVALGGQDITLQCKYVTATDGVAGFNRESDPHSPPQWVHKSIPRGWYVLVHAKADGADLEDTVDSGKIIFTPASLIGASINDMEQLPPTKALTVLKWVMGEGPKDSFTDVFRRECIRNLWQSSAGASYYKFMYLGDDGDSDLGAAARRRLEEFVGALRRRMPGFAAGSQAARQRVGPRPIYVICYWHFGWCVVLLELR